MRAPTHREENEMMDRKDIIKRYKWLCGKAYKSGVLYVDLDYCPYEKSFSNEDIEKCPTSWKII